MKTARQQGKITYFKKDSLIIRERKPDLTSDHSLSGKMTDTPSISHRNTRVSQLVNVFSLQPSLDSLEPSVPATAEVSEKQSGPTLRPRTVSKS